MLISHLGPLLQCAHWRLCPPPTRAGDSVAVWAATELAEKALGWKAKYGITEMCKHQWNWATKYPQGYETPIKDE